MKKYILPLLSIVIMMTMASCSLSDDEVAENNKAEVKLVPMTFTATQESNVGTRAALDSENKVNWQANDEISLFDGAGNQKFTLTGEVSDGKFSGTASATATKFTAVYPYTSGAQLESDGKVSGIELPAEQTATLGSFDPAAALMMAYTTDKSQLKFKNAVSLVKITTTFDCKKIVLSADKEIAGTGTLNYNSDAPSITFTSNTSKTVTLKPATGETFAAGTYYIVIPAITLSGFSISFTNSDDSKVYTRTSTAENQFNRSKIKDFGTFTENGTWTSTIEGNGNVKASQQVDMGVFNIGGTDYRLIFTKSNLTENGLAENEYDYGDYFAWGALKPWYTSYSGKTFDGWKEGKTDGYVQSNAPFYDSSSYTEYTNQNDILKPEHDAAHQILGGGWQLPTKEIWKALFSANRTTVYWGPNNGDETLEKINNIDGMKITKKDAPSIYLFLPAAGRVGGTLFRNVGSEGRYWSGTAYSNAGAYLLYFSSGNVNEEGSYYRYYGLSVRPVRLVAE